MKIGLVGCGSKKKDEASPAAYLYDSKYFELKRKWADQHCDIWFILSAEHGVIQPHKIIYPYNTNIKDVDTEEWGNEVIYSIATFGSTKRYVEKGWENEVVFLAGQDYIEPVKDYFEAGPWRTNYLFEDTSGIGEQIKLLKEEVSE